MVTPTTRSPFPFFLLKISFMIIVMITIAAAGTTAAADADTTSATGGGSSTTAKKLQLKQQQRQGRRRLLVFGDSYADTGNLPKMISPSWKQPYGVTFPKKPSGRFSDGRVFTDFFASWMGIKSPVPYKYRTRRSAGNSSNSSGELLPFGMNFAVGGSGVFDTLFLSTNLTAQISNLEEQVSNNGGGGVNVIDDIVSFTALVVISGNDYVFYKDNGGTMDGLKSFTPKLINQLKLELNRLVKLGVGKVAVTNLHPVGCLPSFTVDSAYTRCNASLNLAAVYHNNLLEEAVRELNFNINNNTGTTSVVIVVDLFHAFMSVLNQGRKFVSAAGGSKGKGSNMTNILKPCCEAESSGFSCGSVDVNGVKKFKLCRRPESAFYWDSSHPTQAAWNAVFSSLKLTHS